MRKPVIVANWKMHKTVRESVEFVNLLVRTFPDPTDREIVIAPPFTALYAACCAAAKTPVKVAAQNVYWQKEGAYTGEISAGMLAETGCDYVIVGHSERRRLFAETDEEINRKVSGALQYGLSPILCIGETLDERESDRTFDIIESQLKRGLNNIGSDDINHVLIAYEPVWAIGTGKTAKPEQAQEVHRFIRKQIESLYGNGSAAEIVILYGGSVNTDNIDSLMSQPEIDGVLVGGAGLNPDSLIRIINFQAGA